MSNPFKNWTPQMVEDYNRRDHAALEAADNAWGKRFESLAVDEEIPLHSEILEECKRRGWLAFHGSTVHKTKRTAGEPDFEVFADYGRVFCVEVKSKTGKLTEEQQGVQHWLTKLGHETFVIRSFDEFVAICDRTNGKWTTKTIPPL